MKTNLPVKIFAAFLLPVAVLLPTACSDTYLDTSPSDEISETQVYADVDALRMAINGIHRHMVSQDGSSQGLGGEPGYNVSRESLGDDMTWQKNGWHQTTLQWKAHRSGTNSVCSFPWRYYYRWAMNANLVLEQVDAFKDNYPNLADGLRGEALCFRAFTHFQIVQMYAQRFAAGTDNDQLGIPYRLTSHAVPMERSTVAEVYDNINRDLDEAITLLADYAPEDAPAADRRTHFTVETAYGLKARVALAQQDYATAAEAAAKALELAAEQGYRLMEGDELFHGFATIGNDTDETLWGAFTKTDQTIYFYSFYANMSWNYNATAIREGVKSISLDTYEKMSPTDLRRQWWDPEGSADGLPASNYFSYPGQTRKFRAVSSGDAVGHYPFMRIAELYLIRAEALARQGLDAQAQEVLTAFAVTRDPEYAPQHTGEALIEEIMTHRRIELWGEGFRWFDLKRLNLPLERHGSNFDAAFCGILETPAGDPAWQYAIPQEELDANPLMVANP
jgi:tetratricopeptide (TPR) repeat protein